MLDHISLPVLDLELSAKFYDSVLEVLGYRRVRERPGAIGYGPQRRAAPVFWILARSSSGAAEAGIGLHVSFQSGTRQMVDEFHQAALSAGGRDAGAPGERPEYTQPFYGAFVLDLDGFKVEAVCRE
ncbi:MAG: VOC family protein [Pseudomonadales bacterium]